MGVQGRVIRCLQWMEYGTTSELDMPLCETHDVMEDSGELRQ
jgi:hypothetical protein